jgi:hypothetical protein
MWFLSRKGTSGFSASSTAEDVTQGIDGSGLTAIVTGQFFLNPRKSDHLKASIRDTFLFDDHGCIILQEHQVGLEQKQHGCLHYGVFM